MNLIKDPWLPIVRKNGTKEKIAIHKLLDNYSDNPAMELEAPRPDFKNALYQLLIGIVQVSAIPEKERNWKKLFIEPYDSEDFSERVLKYKDCFEIDSNGPAFMQDFNLKEAEEKPISTLLIEAPGANTRKNNQAHFIKGGMVESVDAYWASIALYTLQTFAPSGGAGHRVGLRGGGPLTTIILPHGEASLWEKLWCNIISEEIISTLSGDISLADNFDIFPWMKPTKLSSTKGSELFSGEVHPFYHFFGMPRRIRLNFSCDSGLCDLTGDVSNSIVNSFITKIHGNNYDGVWMHPLNAYGHDPKKPEDFPLSIKPQDGGISYRHWLGFAVETERVIPAKVIKLLSSSNYRKDVAKERGIILWAAGFNMDNMKAKGWYESTMPIYPLDSKDTEVVTAFTGGLIAQAHELSSSLRYAVKSAWFGSPKDAKGDMSFLDSAFWQNTEPPFYSLLERLVKNLGNDEIKNNLIEEWGKTLTKEAETLFDSNALAQQEDGLNMKRVVKARKGLKSGIGKMINNLKTLKEVEE
ncbi:MAG: type I-E CRISPR-associated protein Cse1/CasA [Spirochaetia bacterium]|jgi:CRISPR system Cascade subunit CasA|nr:type I-E CRISPR-associated protein Cse1/CasA [Spirochaetia bacterium]